MIMATPQIGKQKPGFTLGKNFRFELDGRSYDFSRCNSGDEIVAAVEKDSCVRFAFPDMLRILEMLAEKSDDKEWIDAFKAGYATPIEHKFDLPCDFGMYACWLFPYVGTRAVTDEQLRVALLSGLDVMEIHNRLLEAEGDLYYLLTEDSDAWDTRWNEARQAGWLEACTKIAWLDGPENPIADFENFTVLAHLEDIADLEVRDLRRRCYARYLACIDDLHEPAVMIRRKDFFANLSNWRGRSACIEAAWLFVEDNYDDTDFVEVAALLKTTDDIAELRAIAGRRKAIEAKQAVSPIWTPFGYMTADEFRRLQS